MIPILTITEINTPESQIKPPKNKSRRTRKTSSAENCSAEKSPSHGKNTRPGPTTLVSSVSFRATLPRGARAAVSAQPSPRTHAPRECREVNLCRLCALKWRLGLPAPLGPPSARAAVWSPRRCTTRPPRRRHHPNQTSRKQSKKNAPLSHPRT